MGEVRGVFSLSSTSDEAGAGLTRGPGRSPRRMPVPESWTNCRSSDLTRVMMLVSLSLARVLGRATS
jgi:hypothetical protein